MIKSWSILKTKSQIHTRASFRSVQRFLHYGPLDSARGKLKRGCGFGFFSPSSRLSSIKPVGSVTTRGPLATSPSSRASKASREISCYLYKTNMDWVSRPPKNQELFYKQIPKSSTRSSPDLVQRFLHFGRNEGVGSDIIAKYVRSNSHKNQKPLYKQNPKSLPELGLIWSRDPSSRLRSR